MAKGYRLITSFSVRGVRELNKRLNLIASNQKALRREFNRLSFEYIKERANMYIDQTTGKSSWYVLTGNLKNSWVVNLNIATMINQAYYSGFVEFGTGIVGRGTHEHTELFENSLSYTSKPRWSFKYEDMIITTSGMVAHNYLSRAIMDYKIHSQQIFNKAFDKVIGGKLRGK